MPEWLSFWAGVRLLHADVGGYTLRSIDGVMVIEPESGVGPAYAQDPQTRWWQYLYDVAVGMDVAAEVAVGTGAC